MLDILIRIAIGFAVLAPVLWIAGSYNHLIRLRALVEKDFGNLDVILKQRFDELPALVEVCKGYAAHEHETLRRVTELRSQHRGSIGQARVTGTGAGLAERLLFENEIVAVLGGVRGLVEAYPDLKADAQFVAVRQRISELEDQIADRRELFNQTVTNFNTFIGEFPPLLFARLFRYTPLAILQATPEERENPGVALTPANTVGAGS